MIDISSAATAQRQRAHPRNLIVGGRTHPLIGNEVVLSTVRRPDRRTTTGRRGTEPRLSVRRSATRCGLFSDAWRGNGKEGSSADERVPLQLGVLGVGGDTDQPDKRMIDRTTRSTLRIDS
jgi:hypothetical protein